MDDARPVRIAFLIGSPRSGTTWLQNMLAARPEIVTPPELGLYTAYIEPMWQQWSEQVNSYTIPGRRRRWGLPLVLSEDDFLETLALTARSVYARMLAEKPGSHIVLDKDPGNSFYIGLIARLFPDSTFLHLIRDGREVAASLLRISNDWATEWAPRTMYGAARRWNDSVRAARRAEQIGSRYEEIRYEDLAAGDASVLVRAFKVVGVDVDLEEAAEILRANRSPSREALVRRPNSRVQPETVEPTSSHSASSSPSNWTPYQRYAFEREAGDLLIELGYSSSPVWRGTFPRPLHATRLASERGRDAVTKVGRRIRRLRAG